jgi:copper chaperone CopZ
MKTETLASSTGLLAAFAASLCCIAPVLAVVSGTTGVLAGFAWLAPLRPYLIGTSALALAAAWYVHLRPTPAAAACDCSADEVKRPLLQSRGFLGAVTVLAVILLAVPSLAALNSPISVQHSTVPVNEQQLMTATFTVEGMTCGGCEKHVSDAVYGVAGVIELKASYAEKNTIVIFDAEQTTAEQISAAIATTGYTVTGFTVSETTSKQL